MISVLFLGSPEEVVPVLQCLIDDEEIKVMAVVTQPDRPVGRKKVMTPTPVRELAMKKDLEVLTPKEFDEGFYHRVSELMKGEQLDMAILAAYGAILPHRLLELPKYGFLNLHPSLLPKYRGASPCVGPILSGDKKTGLTIIKMDEALDHGPIVAQFEDEVSNGDTHRSLEKKLFTKGAKILSKIIKRYILWLNGVEAEKKSKFDFESHESGSPSLVLQSNYSIFLPPKKQNDDQATFTKMLKKDDGFVPWKIVKLAMNEKLETAKDRLEIIDLFSKKLQPFLQNYSFPKDLAVTLERFIRALAPWPGAWTEIEISSKKSKLKLLSAHTENERLVLDEIRLEGKSTMTWEKFQKSFLK